MQSWNHTEITKNARSINTMIQLGSCSNDLPAPIGSKIDICFAAIFTVSVFIWRGEAVGSRRKVKNERSEH